MADKVKKDAKKVYRALLRAVEMNGWTCDKDDENTSVTIAVQGTDLPITFSVFVDGEKQLVKLLSRIPIEFGKDKITDGAVAVCNINYALTDGRFDLDATDGLVYYRMTATFFESDLSQVALLYMINYATWAIDTFNGKLLAISAGNLSVEDFLANMK